MPLAQPRHGPEPVEACGQALTNLLSLSIRRCSREATDEDSHFHSMWDRLAANVWLMGEIGRHSSSGKSARRRSSRFERVVLGAGMHSENWLQARTLVVGEQRFS